MATYEEIYSRLINDSTIANYLEKSSLTSLEQHDLLKYIIASVSHFKRNKKYVYESFPKDFIVLDIETTGLKKESEIIQFSAIKFKNEKKISEFNSYVKPSIANIPTKISYLTGIEDNTLSNAPTFDSLKESILTFIGNLPIVGHNIVGFDLPFLKNKGLDLYNHSLFDTLSILQTVELKSENYKLETIKKYYGIEGKIHDSLSDCEAEAKIFLKLAHKDYVEVKSGEPANLFLKDKKVTISGSFSKVSRNSMEMLVARHGGKVMKSITKNTDYFIDGKQIANNLVDGVHSSKELKAHELFKETKKPIILNEDDALSLFKNAGEKI